jgi:UV excision repair protein RAD23
MFDFKTIATGKAFETAVSNMVEMGFPREEVIRAMRAAFNNPDRAVEYLMNVRAVTKLVHTLFHVSIH